jgi:hypothetical protein
MRRFKTICMSAAFLSFVASSAFAVAPPNTVELLFSSSAASSSPGATAQVSRTVGPFDTDALVFTSATGRTTGTGSSGAVTRIQKDGRTIASDGSFENAVSTATVRHEMNAGRQFLLKKDIITTVTANVEPRGAGGSLNANTTIQLYIDAIQVCRGNAC